MPIVGLKLDAVRSYQSKHDPEKGTPEATTFKLGTLDSRVMGRIRDLATSVSFDPNAPDDEVETSINTNEVNFTAVSYGLKGWENFRDKNGNDIEFKTLQRRHSGVTYDIVDPEVLKIIPMVVISELAAEIMKDNELSENEGND